MASIRRFLRVGRTAAALACAIAVATPARAQRPSPASPAAAAPAQPQSPLIGDGVAAQQVDVAARPVAIISGRANWQDGYSAIYTAIAKLSAALAKANLKTTGAPFAVFAETDDQGFRYQAMAPIAAPPPSGASLGPDVTFGLSPAGKALKFERRGAYAEIDDAYEAIADYLDEKGLEAKDPFIEEFVTDAPRADDPSLVVDIYIFIQ